MIRVGINGFGTIGKRVADAVSLQDDMEVSGVTLTKPSFKAEIAIKNGYKLYSAIPGNEGRFGDIPIEGDINKLIEESDIIIDASPKPFGAENKKRFYLKRGVKAIFQGGEKPQVADISFNAQTNFDSAIGKNYVRVVSCNTTGLCRTLGALEIEFGINSAYAVLVRRSADPHDSKKGPINAIIPETEMPSHHGPDVKTVMPINIVTTAVKVPTTIMHLHILSIKLKNPVSLDDVIDVLTNTTRIKLIEEKMGFKSTAEIMEYARDFGRKRGDLYEIAIWKESININDKTLYLMQAVHQEADVIPENIDAIRAMLEISSKEESIEKTNKSLGIE